MLDQAESLRKLANGEMLFENHNKARIITITSGKGGVGKSNIVVNLAINLVKKGKKVLIFDADIGMGNDDVLMGIYPKHNVLDLVNGRLLIEDVIVEGPEGVKLLPGGSGLNNIEDLQQNQRDLFLRKIEMLEGFDYIFIDTGAGISRSVLAFIACSDEVILITTPEPTSLTDGYSLLKAVNHFKIKNKANIIVNKALDKNEGEKTFLKFKSAVNKFLSLDVIFLGQVYEDRKLVMSVRNQLPFIIGYPKCDASKCIEDITKSLIDSKREKLGGGAEGLFKKLFSIFS
ncbi:MinD/ParA family protein [Clostridium sp. Sa3CUN1]|uniref:MinD/ParA family protein n=1 Tax=Clostridium gallinarum TaxID=2762246 RepID=A0ABR8Q4I6_9CLOT|nr:MinD/ParA family protein [Clostridium gallinarum]MBD7915310.1 MinD/ParA family protein [Clostridium gallinarum]